VTGFCKEGTEHSGLLNGRELLDYLSGYQLLKENSVCLLRRKV
jgi:hypothetical protein